jgi:hypothetical protein
MKEKKKNTTKKVAPKATTKKTTKKETKKVEVKEVKKQEVKETPKKVEVKPTLEEMFGISTRGIITIVVVTLLFIGLAVGIASLIKNKQKTTNTSDATIQYSEILLGNLLDQTENTYYVFVYESNDNYITTYNTYLSNYKTKENALKVYTAALNNGFNKKFLSEEKNLYVSNISDLKVMGTTLLKVEGKKVVEAYDGKDSIISHLKQLVK